MNRRTPEFDGPPRPYAADDAEEPCDGDGRMVELSRSALAAVERMRVQVEAFDDRLRAIEKQLTWSRNIEDKIGEFRDELASLRRRLASAASLPVEPLHRLLEELVTVLVGRVYADASRRDAEAIEKELNGLLDEVTTKFR